MTDIDTTVHRPSRTKGGASPRPSEYGPLDTLLELSGVEFAWTSGSVTEPERYVCPDEAPARPTAVAWARLQMAHAQRAAEELDLGQPRVLVTVHDRRLLVLGMGTGTQVALVLREPASAGMAMVKVRQWIEAHEGEA